MTEERQPSRLLRLTDVKARTGKSTSSIYEAIAVGTFPRPVKVGPRTSAWVESEIDAWIEARISERNIDHVGMSAGESHELGSLAQSRHKHSAIRR